MPSSPLLWSTGQFLELEPPAKHSAGASPWRILPRQPSDQDIDILTHFDDPLDLCSQLLY